MDPGGVGYCYPRTGAAGLLHLKRLSSTATLCRKPAGDVLQLQLSRERLEQTCPPCAQAFAKLISSAPAKVRGPSVLEETFKGQAIALGLPPFERELRFARERLGRDWRFDFAWPAPYMVGVEIDGGLWARSFSGHGHTKPAEIEQDMIRNAAAQLLGWRVFRGSPDLVQSGLLVSWVELALLEAVQDQKRTTAWATVKFPPYESMRDVRWKNRSAFRSKPRR